MGRQSSRLIYQEKDHKDIYFQGKYHKAMYLGNQLLWKKLGSTKYIPFMTFDGNNRMMCIDVLYVDSKTIKRTANLINTEFNDNKLARGDNTVGYMLKDTSWAFSSDGQKFVQTKRLAPHPTEDNPHINNYISAFLGYALTKSCFLGIVLSDYQGGTYYVLSYDIDTYNFNGSRNSWKFDELISGYLDPKLDLFISRGTIEGYIPGGTYRVGYGIRNAKYPNRGLFGFNAYDESKFLGVSDSTVYVFRRDYDFATSYVQRYNYINDSDGETTATISKDFYFNIRGSFYENGKFIVYYSEREIGKDGRLQIYETIDFLSFAEVETPRSIVVKDMDSDGEYTISFDSDVNGDIYIQPYCNLDNTFYFDEDGMMHNDEGCLFHTNISELRQWKIVTIYFDNHYFRESEGNFCQILTYEKEDIEPPIVG